MKWLLALPVLLMPGTLAAQELTTDHGDIALLALSAVRSKILEGQEFTLGPEYYRLSGSFGGSMSSQERTIPASVLSRSNSAAIIAYDDAATCTTIWPSSCRMVRGIAAIRLARPVIEGNAAVVDLTVLRPTKLAGFPTQRLDYEVDLRRVEGVWIVVATRRTGIT